jgi:hypothetical protein
MKDTRVSVQKTLLYTVSGGFISLAFGILGATAAHAGPRVPVEAGGGGKAVTAPPPPKAPPGGTPQQQQKELSQLKAKANKPAPKAAPEQAAKQSPRPDDRTGPQSKNNDKKPVEKKAEPKPVERKTEPKQEKRSEPAVNHDKRGGKAGGSEEPPKKKESVSGLRALEVKDEIDKKAGPARAEADKAAKDRDKGPTGSVRAYETTERIAGEKEAEAKRLERLRDAGKPKEKPKRNNAPGASVSGDQDREPPKSVKTDTPVSGLRALEVKDEIEKAAGPARAEADHWAKERDKGATGSVRAWETTERIAAEKEAEAGRLARVRGEPTPKPKHPVLPRTTKLKEPISGLRALEVKDEIEKAAGPARDEADRWARFRDQGVTGSVRAYETTERIAGEKEAEASRLERLRGKPKRVQPLKTIELDEPISGLRALEVKDQISKSVEPAKEEAKKWKELRDAATGPEREEYEILAKEAGREARRLEYLDNAGSTVGDKFVDNLIGDVSNGDKRALAVGDGAVGVAADSAEYGGQKQADDAGKKVRDAARNLTDTRSAARLPDGSIDPAKQADIAQKRALLRTAVTDNATATARNLQHAKLAGKLAKGGTGIGFVSGVAYDVIEEEKPLDDALAGGLGGFVGGAAGGAAAGAAAGAIFGGVGAIPGAFIGGVVGGFIGSAAGEAIYKDNKEAEALAEGKDIRDAVNEED